MQKENNSNEIARQTKCQMTNKNVSWEKACFEAYYGVRLQQRKKEIELYGTRNKFKFDIEFT